MLIAWKEPWWEIYTMDISKCYKSEPFFKVYWQHITAFNFDYRDLYHKNTIKTLSWNGKAPGHSIWLWNLFCAQGSHLGASEDWNPGHTMVPNLCAGMVLWSPRERRSFFSFLHKAALWASDGYLSQTAYVPILVFHKSPPVSQPQITSVISFFVCPLLQVTRTKIIDQFISPKLSE